jgi:hypothetical protein
VCDWNSLTIGLSLSSAFMFTSVYGFIVCSLFSVLSVRGVSKQMLIK